MADTKKIYIDHEFRNHGGYVGMLIPFGEYKNKSIADSQIGDLCITADSVVVRIISKSVVAVPSQVSNTISQMLYGASIELSLSAMMRNWGYDIYNDRVLFIVIEKI